jgi:hypothetical protein
MPCGKKSEHLFATTICQWLVLKQKQLFVPIATLRHVRSPSGLITPTNLVGPTKWSCQVLLLYIKKFPIKASL